MDTTKLSVKARQSLLQGSRSGRLQWWVPRGIILRPPYTTTVDVYRSLPSTPLRGSRDPCQGKNLLGHDTDVAQMSAGNSPTGEPVELAVT
jgi:hypothetical protein